MIGDNILRFRKEKGWSQEDLAEKMEVSRQTISKWESGRIVPGTERLKELAQVLGVSFYALVDEPAAPQNDGGAPRESTPVGETAAPRKHIVKRIVIIALAMVVIVAAIFIVRSVMQPNYRQAGPLKKFIAEQISTAVPYSTVELSGLVPDAVRSQLRSEGIETEISDAALQEAIDLYLGEFFEAYAEYGLSYDAIDRRLLLDGAAVESFYDNNLFGTYQTLTWYGEGSITVYVERDARGSLLDMTAFDREGEIVGNWPG